MVKDFLDADKKVYDSVHGFIPFDEFEKELIDSPPFQRLHYIHQLGIAYMVYPGATHTRFEHSLGTMALATLIFEKICKSVRPDAFHFVPRKGSSDFLYWRRVLRMAALCHDLGHLPFSHVAEADLLGPLGHEHWTLQIIDSPYLKPVWDKLRGAPSYLEDLVGRDIIEDIKKIAVGEEKWKKSGGKSFTPWERVVSEVITGNFFGADRIDYLLRDAKSTGVTYGLFDYHQLIEMLRILPSAERGGDELRLGIDEHGLEACEALLLARHFMQRRVYHYSSVRSYNFHLRRYMQVAFPRKALERVEDFLRWSDIDIIAGLQKAAADPSLPGHADAKCIIFRKNRFRAVSVPDSVGEKELKDFKQKQKIGETELGWELQLPLPAAAQKFSFPVSRRHITIQKACDCSDWLFKTTAQKASWVFVAPDRESELIQFLEMKAQ